MFIWVNLCPSDFTMPGSQWELSIVTGEGEHRFESSMARLTCSTDWIMSVSVTTHPTFSASVPRPIADIPSPLLGTALANSFYDASPDGQRFLFVKANKENGPPEEVRVVLNWTEELKQLMSNSK